MIKIAESMEALTKSFFGYQLTLIKVLQAEKPEDLNEDEYRGFKIGITYALEVLGTTSVNENIVGEMLGAKEINNS